MKKSDHHPEQSFTILIFIKEYVIFKLHIIIKIETLNFFNNRTKNRSTKPIGCLLYDPSSTVSTIVHRTSLHALFSFQN